MTKEMKNLCWTAEELRTGGSHGKTGEVTAKHGSLLATLNRNLAEMLENYPQNLAAVTDEITKSLKALETVMKEGLEKKKRPAEGPPPEPKKVKFQHPGTHEEFTGTEKERDQKMAQWWSEIAANSAASGSNVTGNPGTGNPPQPMPPHGMAPPMSTPMTPMPRCICRLTVRVVFQCHRMVSHHHRDTSILLLWGQCQHRACQLSLVRLREDLNEIF